MVKKQRRQRLIGLVCNNRLVGFIDKELWDDMIKEKQPRLLLDFQQQIKLGTTKTRRRK